MKRERIGLVHAAILARNHVKLVRLSLPNHWNEGFPDAGLPSHPHRVTIFIPPVEAARNKNTIGVWGPHGEVRASLSVERARVRAPFVK